MPRDSFDVYYFQNGRWSVHASFEGDQREQAINEAMGVESKLGYPARVIRETFYEDSNTSDAVVTWQGAKSKKMGDSDNKFGASSGSKPASKPTSSPRRAGTAGPVSRPLPQPSGPAKQSPVKAKPKKKGRSVLTDLAIAIAVSAVIGVVSAAVIGIGTLQLQSRQIIGKFDSSPLIFGSFILVFFVSMLVRLNKMFKLFAALRTSSGAKSAASDGAPQAGAKRVVRRKPTPQDIKFTGVAVERGAEPAPEPEQAPESAPEEALPTLDEPPSLESPSDTPAETQPETAPPEPMPAAAPPEPSAPPPPPPAMRPDDDARQTFATFISESLSVAKRDVGDLNSVTRMGFNLFLSGSMATLGNAKKLSREGQVTILKQGLQAAGNSPERASAFTAELPSYSKNPKYAGMIQAGVKAMEGHLGGQPQAAAAVGPLLSEWTLPEKRPAAPQVFTFMFTDMVGSTAITQELGNAEAQKIVRAHNNVVRNALAQFKGREVKHTGDGIMAVFGDAASAVMSAVQMQRKFLEHNASFPNLPLTVRIGLNTGEAVQEENDFFGNAVQLSARVCSQATNGQVWASQSVVDGCQGRKLGFIQRGKFQMKGIQGARALYEVGWTDAHRNELADL